MSIVECFETTESLSSLAFGVDYPDRVLRLLITDMVSTHYREYGSGLVMSLLGTFSVVPISTENHKDDLPRLRVQFYDDWAKAASFVDPGDILILKGFRLVRFPVVEDGLPSNACKNEDRKFFVVPIPKESVFRAIQKCPDTGLTSEVTVNAGILEEPRVRVMPVQAACACSSDVRTKNQ